MYCSVGIVFLHLQNMLLDTLQCLLWVYTYSKCCQIQCSVFIVGCISIYLQYLLLDALQCLYCGSINIVNIVTCIAMSLLWVYTYSIYCQMHCSVCCWFIPIVNIVDVSQCLYCRFTPVVYVVRYVAVSIVDLYLYSKHCQMYCSVFIVGLYL